MTKIKLFHSYLFISNSKNIYEKNNKIYNQNNEFICGLLNIPKNKFFSKIILEKNLIKNKQSKKTNTFFEKNNIKVYIEYNIKQDDLKSFYNCNLDQFFNLVKFNYLNFIDPNEILFKTLCINQNCKRDIINTNSYSVNQINPNIIKIYNLFFNLGNNTITSENKIQKSILKKNYIVNGLIIYTDYINETINNICKICMKNSSKKILIIYDKSNKRIWLENIKNSNFNYIGENNRIKDIGSNIFFSNVNCLDNLKENNKYDIVIFDNTKLNHENFSFQNSKKIYISYETLYTENVTLKNFINTLNIVFDKDFNYTKITHENLCNLSKIIVNHNFYNIFLKNGIINNYKIQNKLLITNNKYEYNSNNLINNIIKFNIDPTKREESKYCSICMENFNSDFFLETNCNHNFCKTCCSKLLEFNYNCSICRGKINKFTLNLNKYEDIFDVKKWYYIGDSNKKVIQNIISSKTPSMIYFEDKNYFNYFKSILEITPYKSKVYLFLNNIDKNCDEKIQNNLKLFYYKTKKKMINSEKKIVMMIKNYYKNVSMYILNIN